jgi:dienelactone hydrolase
VNRRRFLSLSALVPFASCAPPRGADALPTAARDYRRCLPDHLRSLAARAREIREAALRELTTADAVRRRQAWVRETLWQLVGGRPERTPLRIETTGTLERAGYRVEKLVYESRPGFLVTANLYLPEGREGPCPGVLFQLGHLDAGKGAAPYQIACQALVKRGHVVLAFDPLGQGERRRGAAPIAAEDEHDRVGRRLLLVGDTATRLMLWDAVRSLDVLAARPEVDPGRLASVGHSGGGTLTMLLAAVDDRLAAAAVSCGNTEDLVSADFDPPGAVDDAEQILPGAGPLGFDRWDLLYPLAPRPLLVLVSTADALTTYSPRYLTNGRAELERLERASAQLGGEGRARWVETASPHALEAERRSEIQSWLGRFLLGETAPPTGEPETEAEPEEATWATPSGNVQRTRAGKTPLDLARARADELAAERAASDAPIDLASMLGLARPPARPATVLASARGYACRVDLLEIRSAPAVTIPAWLFRPDASATPGAVVIAIEPGGRRAAWQDELSWQALARRGHVVCAADLRGTGALTPELGPGASGYARAHGVEASFAAAALMLGESLLTQQVVDLLALVEALSLDPALAGRPLALAAQGPSTLPGLFAAALDARIALVYLDGGLASYRSLLDVEDDRCPPGSILPGVLAGADLPEIAAAAGPRRVILAGPVDGAGLPLPLAEAHALYRGAPNVQITPPRGWGSAALGDILDQAASPSSRP